MKRLPSCGPTCRRLPYVTRYTRAATMCGPARRHNVAVIVDAGLRPSGKVDRPSGGGVNGLRPGACG
jgi:hypothetical protein